MNIFNWLLGKYLASSEESEQTVGPVAGLPLLGLDALSSSAYGPEAALTVLLPMGAAGLHYILPLSGAIIALLLIVFFSYRQTIDAYPGGGGSYTVAKENLGTFAGLLAAAALLLDYVLTVAVGIAAGVGALISALPSLEAHTLLLCLSILFLLTVINLRGIKESGSAFLIPTYAFLVCLGGVLAWGLLQSLLQHGAPVPVEHLPTPSSFGSKSPLTSVGLWLILRAFASGCTAMTGVEAVSNGVKVFREPVVTNARRTLTMIVLTLVALLGAIAYLAWVYKIYATNPGEAGYESMISQLVRAIIGRGFLYYLTLGTVTVVLCLSANTAFADFPRLFQIMARDGFLPEAFAERGRRLVFSNGILALAILSGLLLILFGGVTDRLIPLYAIGAFLAFTLSQLGMVFHWLKNKTRSAHVWFSLFINALGAAATGVTLLVVLVSKFAEGGWISALLVPLFVALFYAIHRHYEAVALELATDAPLSFDQVLPPLVIVPVYRWGKATRKALQFATEISPDVYAVHVQRDNLKNLINQEEWARYVKTPAESSGKNPPALILLPSPYRLLFSSVFQFIDELEKQNPNRQVAVILPSLVQTKWYQAFLHNHRAVLLNAALYLRKDPRLVWITVPWFL
jgi:amino acid transporter